MVVTDLKTEPSKRSSKRRHPMHSVVKGADNLYAVHTPARPLSEEATLNDLRLRVNALELSQSVLEREVAVLQERGTPFDGVVVPTAMLDKASKVTPMRMTGPTHVVKSEQSKVVQAPSPVPANMVQGSTALALPAPTDDDVVTPIKPTLSRVGQLSDKAATNDGAYLPPEEVAKLEQLTDESPEVVADLGFQYGMDIVEVSEILSREYSRRERHAYDTHGKTRSEVQLDRLIGQKGIVAGAYYKSEDSYFKGWFSGTEEFTPLYAARAMGTAYRDGMRLKIFGGMGFRTTGLVPPWEQHQRDVLVEQLKATMRKTKGTFKENDTVAATLKGVGVPRVTTDSQTKMFGSLFREVGDRLRRTKVAKAIGLGPKLRTVKQREQFEAEFDGSEVQFSQEFPLLYRERSRHSMTRSLRLKRMNTVRILRPQGPDWQEANSDEAVQRKMDMINGECLKRGIHTPVDLTIFQGQMTKVFTDQELSEKVAATK